MPKYKSPDGKVFPYISTAFSAYCDEHECNGCPIGYAPKEQGEACVYYAVGVPDEAARLMGYEIIEDDQPESNQEAKSDSGKPRLSLVPPALIRGVDAIREFGTARYGSPDNWRKVEPQRYWDALLRHALEAWDNWKAIDPESGMPHLWHIACNAAFLMQYMEEEQDEATKHLP